MVKLKIEKKLVLLPCTFIQIIQLNLFTINTNIIIYALQNKNFETFIL